MSSYGILFLALSLFHPPRDSVRQLGCVFVYYAVCAPSFSGGRLFVLLCGFAVGFVTTFLSLAFRSFFFLVFVLVSCFLIIHFLVLLPLDSYFPSFFPLVVFLVFVCYLSSSSHSYLPSIFLFPLFAPDLGSYVWSGQVSSSRRRRGGGAWMGVVGVGPRVAWWPVVNLEFCARSWTRKFSGNIILHSCFIMHATAAVWRSLGLASVRPSVCMSFCFEDTPLANMIFELICCIF